MKEQIQKYSQAGLSLRERKRGDDAQREALILKFAPLVKYIADRVAMQLPSGISREDLISAGILGLNNAIDRFDSEKGVRFKTFAAYRIKGAMVDEMRRMGWASRSVIRDHQRIEEAKESLKQAWGREATDGEVADHLGVKLNDYHKMLWRTRRISLLSLDEVMPDGNTSRVTRQVSDAPSPFDALKVKELKKIIAEEISNLKEKEQIVISLYYYEELTLKEIGQVLNLTESRISQIHSQVISKFRARLQARRDQV